MVIFLQQMHKNYADVMSTNKSFNSQDKKDKSLSQLQNKISLSSFQMLELTLNGQKFTERIQQLNQKAFQLIKSAKSHEALIYLGEAQKLLQYAASRGCSLDRQVIIKILNNQATAYQKIWDLQRSIAYIEAIIFHLSTFLELKQNKDIVHQIKKKIQQAENSSLSKEELQNYLQQNFENTKIFIQKKFSFSLFLLQFSLFSSQNQEHNVAIESSIKAVNSYEDTFEFILNYLRLIKIISTQNSSLQSAINLICKVKSVTNLQEEVFGMFDQIKIKFEQKSNTSSSFQFILQKYASLERKQTQYKDFSLNTVLELHPETFKTDISKKQKFISNQDFFEEIWNQNAMIKKILQYSVALFSVSSQMREQIDSQISLSGFSQKGIFEDKAVNAEKYHLKCLKISVEVVEQLSQFSKHAFKIYNEIYQSNTKKNTKSLSKIDSLKKKYKEFISKGDSIIKDLASSEEIFDRTISEYSVKLKPSLKTKQKQNMLQKLFKENSINSGEKVSIQGPPRLNIDLSEIQSVEYGTSKTFKQKNDLSKNPKDIQEQKSLNTLLQVKKILTVPNISDLSSNKQSQISSRGKSKSSKKDQQTKSILKNQKNLKKSYNKIKSVSSKNKHELKKFLSPKNFIQKPNKSPSKKKIFQTELKMFSSKKIIPNQKDSNKKTKKKQIKVDEKVEKKEQHQITPQPSNRNISLKSQLKNELLQKPQTSRNKFKLRKAKSFQEVITPYEDIKPIVYQSKDISDVYKFRFQNKGSKVKLIADSKKTKSTEKIKFHVEKKDKNKINERKNRNQIQISSKNGQRKLQQLKEFGKKKKKQSQIKTKQSNQVTNWKQKAVRMSSLSNLMQPINQKQGLRKIKSSQSIHTLNSSSDYMIKGFNINSSQRTKSGSLAITESLRYK